MKRLPCISIAMLVLSVVLGASVAAGVIESNFGNYLETIGENDFASAIVYLEDRPDIRSLDIALRDEAAPMSVRHGTVLRELRIAANRSQPALLGYLDVGVGAGSVRGYTPYWIMNLVVVSATKAEIYRLADRPDVEAVEGNFQATLIENVGEAYKGDPTAGIGVTNSLTAINADRVWNELGYTGAGTLIGGLDTGVDGNHPALTDRWRGNLHPWAECWRDALGGGTQFPSDGNGHGTHTMGTMCGAAHSTGDTVGVAFDAMWIADNTINQGVGSEFDNDVLGAFQWFTDPDGNPGTTDDVPDVVQNSWGIDARFGGTYQDCDYRWQEAIENCEAAGVVVTFSAGNEGPGSQTHRSPANIINTPTTNFSVGAVNCENYSWPYPIASFSSRGPSDCDGVTIKPEVVGPGVSVYSSYPGGGYRTMSGTSMAGPHVAGVVALMRQANPNADVTTIKTVLMNTARDLGAIGEDSDYGWGIIDAYAAVLAVMQPDTEPPQVTVVDPNGGETLTAGTVHTIRWTATDDVGVTQTSLHYSIDGGANFALIDILSGNPSSYGWTVPNEPSTECLVRVDAQDAAANQGTDGSDGFFTIEESAAPYVWVERIDMSTKKRGTKYNAVATVTVRDQDNNPVNRATVQSHWDGLTHDTDLFTTKRTGVGKCSSDQLKSPTGWWYYHIDNVIEDGYVFRSDLGETADAIYVGGGLMLGAPALGESSITLSGGNPTTAPVAFSIGLPVDAHVQLSIFDVSGRIVKSITDGTMRAGMGSLYWDGTNENGVAVPSGMYLYRFITDGQVVTEKTMLLR